MKTYDIDGIVSAQLALLKNKVEESEKSNFTPKRLKTNFESTLKDVENSENNSEKSSNVPCNKSGLV